MKMKSLRLMATILLVVASLLANANPVDMRTVREVGMKFLNANTRVPLRSAEDLQLVTTYSISRGDAAFHVFNTPNGFVIVAADDCAYPILGYSDEGRQFDINDVPIQLQDILQEYAEQIQYAVERNLQPDEATNQQWRFVKTNGMLSENRDRTQVGPLLTTTWDQGQYYNAMCPEDADGPDGHVLTGCVATAMAQIINYWEYPTQGKGIHSYESYQNTYGTITVNYEESYYDYENMPDVLSSTSTQEEITAVAKLMYDCGVANSMQYGAYGSGAYEENTRASFINHFGYSDRLGYADRHMYTGNEWTTLLKDEINCGAPVFYTGTNGLISHAFVLDGYKEDDYFHFNFGWSGDCDGWYLTSVINPSWEFNYWQQAIVGIRPNNPYQTVLCNYRPEVDLSSGIYNGDHDYYIVSTPIHLYNVSANNDYQMDYDDYGGERPIVLHFSPVDGSGQLVLDVFEIEEGHAVMVYDGVNKDSLVCVWEPLGVGWPNANLPNDPEFQQYVSNDFSPIVSTKHGFTIEAYCAGLLENEFHLLVSDAADCRMVSNIEAIQESSGFRLNWTANGSATQWQVAWNDSTEMCDTSTILIEDVAQYDNCEVKIRSVCGEETYSQWNSIILNKKKYWPDFVVEEPEGFELVDGVVRVSSAEGFAWWIRQCESYDTPTEENSRTIVFDGDIDLEGHLWKPIAYYGKIKGQGHVINNLRTGYFINGTGMFRYYAGDTISDLHLKNAIICGDGGSGAFAACVDHSVIINCSSTDYFMRNRGGAVGGLFGRSDYSKVTNCYAIGENYSQTVNGGIVGWNLYSDFDNCYSSQGASFQWQSCNSDIFGPGLLTGIDYGGSYDNCYADIKNTKRLWAPEYDSIATLYYFFGFSNGHGIQVASANNIATFRVDGDTIGRIIQDTAVNYSLGNMDLLTALNNKVIENNSPELRTWIWDDELHFPVFAEYYEPTCPNVKNLTARNIEIDDGFAVALSWTETGEAEEWQVKCVSEGVPESGAVIHSANSTNDTIEGLTLGKDYTFYVRPICGGEDTVGWGLPVKLFVDKLYWVDVVTEQPVGYVVDSEGNVTISSAEGLAWFNKRNQWDCFEGKTISILNDIDMGAYRWKPLDCIWGTIDGNNHTISNLICRESVSEARGVGFVGGLYNTTIRNMIIKDGVFAGREWVGGLFGYSISAYNIDNCHIENAQIMGRTAVGGIGGMLNGGEDENTVTNCSATGVIYADRSTGGLLGSVQSPYVIVNNCYSHCDIYSLGKSQLISRGGLVGDSSGSFTNCYNAGEIEYDSTVYFNYTGLSIGDISINGEMHNVYAQFREGIPFEGRDDALLVYPYILADTATFDNNCVLNNPVTIAGTSYTDLLSALNAWVDTYDTLGVYRHWVADTAMVNGGFPILERQPATGAQISSLTLGWNWWAPTVERETLLSLMETTLGTKGIRIDSQDSGSAQQNDGSWSGDLQSISPGQMYRIQTNTACTLSLLGVPITSATITINQGENWFGFVGTAKPITTAFTNFSPAEGDKVISQDEGFAVYNGSVWEGTLTTLKPGKGYVYISNATTSKTLVIGE